MTAPTVSRNCAVCGAAFTVLERVTRRPGRGQYCSPTCRGKGRAGIALSTRKRELRVCQCGKPYEVPPSRLKAGKGLYCSRDCVAVAHRKPKVVKVKSTPKPKPVAHKFGAAIRPKPPAPNRPAPVSPRVDDLPLTDGGSHVLCAGCREPRLRGTHCSTCEWRAAEVLAS